MSTRLGSRALRSTGAAVASALAVRAAQRLLEQAPPGGAARWTRVNHAGREVSLLEGPALVVGCAATCWVSPAAAGASVAAGALGLLDDLAGSTASKGLKGHLRGLLHGEVTTGAVKLVGLAATGVLAAASGDRSTPSFLVVDAGVVAGTANLVNLFDLRPGRALKVAALAALPMVPSSAAAAGALGAVVASAPADLAGRTMMGDTGANALGALLGTALVRTLPSPARLAVLTAVVGLTLASEKVSFSAVIERQPLLRRLDLWGRSVPS